MKRLAAAALQREGEVEGAYELVDMVNTRTPLLAKIPASAAKLLREPLTKSDMVTLQSINDHIWLIHHEIGMPAQMKWFSTASAFAETAHQLISAPAKPQIEHDVTLNKSSPAQIAVRRGHTYIRCNASDTSCTRSSRESGRHSSRTSCGSQASVPSSAAAVDDPPLVMSLWLDVQTTDVELIREVLALFPVFPVTVEEVINPHACDTLEVFTSPNYVFTNMRCSRQHHGQQETCVPAGDDEKAHGNVVCSVICFEDWIITIHASPFVGLAECVKKIQADFSLRMQTSSQERRRQPQMGPLMSASWVLAMLTDNVIETFLPDPTVVLAEVDRVDEMVLLIAPGDRDQPDLLRQVALLRRSISTQRALLFKKEQLLQQLLMPLMRTCFVTSNPVIEKKYKRSLLHVIHLSERLDAARDVLNLANSNFVSGVTICVSQASTNVDFRMQLLSLLALICLPPTALAGMFAMNVFVPWQYVENQRAFWSIIGVMVVWAIGCLVPTIHAAIWGGKDTRTIVVDQ